MIRGFRRPHKRPIRREPQKKLPLASGAEEEAITPSPDTPTTAVSCASPRWDPCRGPSAYNKYVSMISQDLRGFGYDHRRGRITHELRNETRDNSDTNISPTGRKKLGQQLKNLNAPNTHFHYHCFLQHNCGSFSYSFGGWSFFSYLALSFAA